MQGERTAVRFSTTLGKEEMYIAVPVEQDGRVVAAVRAATPLAAIDDALPALYWRIGVGAAIVAIAAALIGLLVSGGISRQMRLVGDGAGRFADGDFGRKLTVPRTKEFAEVAESLNRAWPSSSTRRSTRSRASATSARPCSSAWSRA